VCLCGGFTLPPNEFCHRRAGLLCLIKKLLLTVCACVAASPSPSPPGEFRHRRAGLLCVIKKLLLTVCACVGASPSPQVNSAIDELASCAEANHRLMAAARASNSKLSGAERKRAIELYHSVASKEGIKGRFWFLDNDLKDGASIRPDKTGKSILMMLRHLKRLEEVRCEGVWVLYGCEGVWMCGRVGVRAYGEVWVRAMLVWCASVHTVCAVCVYGVCGGVCAVFLELVFAGVTCPAAVMV